MSQTRILQPDAGLEVITSTPRLGKKGPTVRWT